MRFKEFLMREDGVSARHIAPAKMTTDQMIEWIQNNASRYVDTGSKIYRGVYSRDAEGLYNGSQLNRTAANTYNYANLWLSNHSDWSAYPPREKSFICSTSGDYVESYGQPYIVIPSDSSTIGICPDQDLWDSFPEVNEATAELGMDEFMRVVHELIQDAGKSTAAAEKDWDMLAFVINDIDTNNVKQLMKNGQESTNELAEHLLSFMEKNRLATLYEVFERVFDPKTNGFSMQKAATLDADSNREVWMTGSILMLQPETWLKIKEQI